MYKKLLNENVEVWFAHFAVSQLSKVEGCLKSVDEEFIELIDKKGKIHIIKKSFISLIKQI